MYPQGTRGGFVEVLLFCFALLMIVLYKLAFILQHGLFPLKETPIGIWGRRETSQGVIPREEE